MSETIRQRIADETFKACVAIHETVTNPSREQSANALGIAGTLTFLSGAYLMARGAFPSPADLSEFATGFGVTVGGALAADVARDNYHAAIAESVTVDPALVAQVDLA